MSDGNSTIPRPATGTPGRGMPVASLEHRTAVHPVTQLGCVECLPAPCKCGKLACPRWSQHYREVAADETSWRMPAGQVAA